MTSNTLCFNKRVQALQVSGHSNRSSNRRQRGPLHGLQGDASSQRKSGVRGTTALRQSQVLKMREKGAAAEVRILAQQLPEVIVTQEYPPAADDEPMPYVHDFNAGMNDGWLDVDSDDEDEAEDAEEGEVEKAAKKFRVEYRDFRTRRDRTDTNSNYWAEQTEGMVDAYMDWCRRKTTGEALPPCDKPSLWIDVIDIFGV